MAGFLGPRCRELGRMTAKAGSPQGQLGRCFALSLRRRHSVELCLLAYTRSVPLVMDSW